ncbi:serine hydrolase [Microbacterium sp. RURRCA19A]|uniref:serine hydrolase n=1 Tax=Microbacterium sp. RURRCA19A TaxID=1907391 RepID=UPI000957066C|nr:serine hydrolase [Microbacterium sp. RURRCA19A]SIR44142.1 D-alanyl-D-alanine carboxypeptidase (penicillin-binding protein 5/6) [Microbacterium sp. RURRCA19A]
MGQAPEHVDELGRFADLLDDAPAASGSGRAGRIALLVVLITMLVAALGTGGYVWWASSAPLPAPTLATQPPPVTAGAAAAVRLPSTGAMRVSVVGGEQYLGADDDGAWAASGGDDPRPIASVAKLITALVVLDRHPLDGPNDPGPTVAFTEADTDLYDQFYVRGATIAKMPDRTTLSLHDALATILLPSASNYAVALARWGYGSEGAYVDAANAWLEANGLTSTRIVDATGLDDRNTSTPRDLVALGKIAESHAALAAIVALPSISLPDGPGYVTNTNDLLGTAGVRGLKTGNLGEGTFNLLFSSLLDVGMEAPLQITGVRLGGETHDSTDQDVAAFLKSVQDGFHDVPVASPGEDLGTITTAWGAEARVVLTRTVAIRTWSDTPITPSVAIVTPQIWADGETVGTVTWTAGPHTASSDLKIVGDLEPPTLWWRLTHPGQLGG